MSFGCWPVGHASRSPFGAPADERYGHDDDADRSMLVRARVKLTVRHGARFRGRSEKPVFLVTSRPCRWRLAAGPVTHRSGCGRRRQALMSHQIGGGPPAPTVVADAVRLQAWRSSTTPSRSRIHPAMATGTADKRNVPVKLLNRRAKQAAKSKPIDPLKRQHPRLLARLLRRWSCRPCSDGQQFIPR